MKIRSKATRTLRATLARSPWVWGGPQQAAPVPCVATEALLATYRKTKNTTKSIYFFITFYT